MYMQAVSFYTQILVVSATFALKRNVDQSENAMFSLQACRGELLCYFPFHTLVRGQTQHPPQRGLCFADAFHVWDGEDYRGLCKGSLEQGLRELGSSLCYRSVTGQVK